MNKMLKYFSLSSRYNSTIMDAITFIYVTNYQSKSNDKVIQLSHSDHQHIQINSQDNFSAFYINSNNFYNKMNQLLIEILIFLSFQIFSCYILSNFSSQIIKIIRTFQLNLVIFIYNYTISLYFQCLYTFITQNQVIKLINLIKTITSSNHLNRLIPLLIQLTSQSYSISHLRFSHNQFSHALNLFLSTIHHPNMIKDFFQKNIELLNELRSQHFKYTEYLSKGKYKLKQKFFGKGKKHYDFDINSQQYFHQEISDISFESTETQEEFFNLVSGAINRPVNVNNTEKFNSSKKQPLLTFPLSISNPSECRVLLSKHFFARVHNLKYKKYLILSRYHNSDSEKKEQELLPFVQSRTQIIDKEIQVSMNREVRLGEEDYFEQSFTQGGKPVPISETGQPIYKYLDEEECWYSNISRDDIIAYTRNVEFKRDLLNEFYYPIESELKSITFRDGLEILFNIEDEFAKNVNQLNKQVASMAQQFNSLLEKQLEIISPGNLVEKENLSNFGYTIFGMISNIPLRLPLYPAIYPQLFDTFNKSTSLFFQKIQFKTHQNIITLLPKLNSFCQILFKYQNHEILEGKKEIKLGLQDDIDVKKELYTMLEELWVRKHVTLPFERFDYKLQLKAVDWPLESISEQISRRNKRKTNFQQPDTSISELIHLMTFTDFMSFRRHMKKRAEKIVSRCQTKYFDMEYINHFNQKTDQKITLDELSDLFRVKFNQDSFEKQPFLKPNAEMFFNQIMKKQWIMNPAEIQIEETLRFLKIRQDRTKMMNVLNGIRCYHRNLCLDLRVLTGEEFKFKLDDDFLINSNKQVVESFEKAIKETATFVTKMSESKENKVSEQFYLPENYHVRSMLYKKDIVTCHFYNNSSQQSKPNSTESSIPHVLVSNGKRRKSKVLYGIVIESDLPLIEQRVLEVATKIINQYERYIKITSKEEIVDRVELLRILMQLELKFIYAKFKLIQKYYYLYENTTSVLDAFKISKTIVELIHQEPIFDFEGIKNSVKYEQLYQNQIEALSLEESLLEKMIQKLKNQEQIKVQTFHQQFCQLSRVPLSAQVYIYRDLQPKEKNKNRLQRINSISSKMSSKSSKAARKENHLNTNEQIREEFDEEDDDADESFDIQNYDEYLLKKDMDAIFDDMIQVDENKDAVPINTAAQQNVVINPRFEGGPHPYNFNCEEIKITSDRKQSILNFYQSLCFASNIREIIKSVQNEFTNIYGNVSRMYQTYVVKEIIKMMNKIILQSLKGIQRWRQFDSYDPYHEIVTQSVKHYQELMGAALDPPSNIQMAIASTLEKHQQKLPPFNVLSVFDYYSIESLICLKKPVNSASYRELALGINFLTFLNIRQSLFQIQLKRQRLIEAYQKLAQNSGSVVERYGTMYTRSGQSDIFLSIQEIKQYRDDQYQFPVLPELIQELKTFVFCQKADVQLLETIVRSSKIKLEDYVIMKNQVGKEFLNTRFDHNRLLAKDQKTLKMIKNRLGGQISNICQDEFKRNSFLKIKEYLKIKVEQSIKQIMEADLSSKLTLPKEKISEYSKSLLEEKFKRKMTFEVIEAYQKDLIDTNVRNKVFVQTDAILKRLRKLIDCAPYLNKKFAYASSEQNLNKKVFYDQKKRSERDSGKVLDDLIREGKITDPFYIYSRQQLCDEWNSQETLYRSNNLNEFKIHAIDFQPPKNKQELFRWLYRIPNYGLSDFEENAFRIFVTQLSMPFTGKAAHSQYLEAKYQSEPPRNRFFAIYSHYSALLQYIEMNYLFVALQMEDDVLESLNFLLENDNIVFEEMYPLNDEISIHQSLAELEKKYLKTCFNYKESRENDKTKLKKKIQQKGSSAKKDNWAVYDQILDFIVSKVQGRGVIRENFLPMVEEIEKVLSMPEGSNDVLEIMKKKTEQMTQFFILATLQAYLNEQHQNSQKEVGFYNYLFPLHSWFIGNQLESYKLNSPFANPRIGVSPSICQDHRETQRFILGIYNERNDRMTKTYSTLERYKPIIMINSIELEDYVRDYLKTKLVSTTQKSLGHSQSENAKTICTFNERPSCELDLYNMNFLSEGLNLFTNMGEENRLKTFTRMRFYYEKVSEYMKIKQNITKPLQIEQTKLNYIKFIASSKSVNLSTVAFIAKPNFPVSAKTFKEASATLKEQIQINTFMIFDKFEQYKAENKIQFGKTQQKMLNTSQETKKNQKLAVIYNSLIREIITNKLTREEFKWRVLSESIKILKNQKLQHVESKKIINTSLIPRVHLIASYSSPLVLERKTFISQQYKLAFAQAFINRFRNKVSRVDLLSSGYGFVITVPDLEDCVNFMNKLLFTFSEKEFKYRLETNQQYFEIMVEAVNEKNKVIKEQQEIIKYLQRKVQSIMEAEYLGKVTKLLHEKTVIEDKLRAVEQSSKGLEDRVRKTVEVQYEKKITSLETENQLLKNKFNEFKELFVILTKDSAKNNFLNVANTIRDKIGDLLNKRIDVKEAFLTGQKEQTKPQSSSNSKYQSIENESSCKKQETQKFTEPYVTEDLQRCKLGDDIIHDPYYITKLITKMRLFNIFKLGCKKIHFEDVENKKTSELKQLHKIQDTVIAQSEREILVRKELNRTQEELAKKVAQFDKLKQSYDLLDNERTKLKILLAGKDKKIEQKEREAIQNLKKLQEIEKLPTLMQSESKIEKAQEERPKISQLRKIHKKKSIKIQKSPFLTSIPGEPSMSVYDRFELSNKDATWREKCEQLYIENKKLLNELQKAQSALTTPTREGYSLNLRQRKHSESFNVGSDNSSVKKEEQQKRFPNLSFKYNLMKQTGGFNP